ncbi:hypothetical protein Q9314_06225 [Shinella sumterensis]|nr:hypothetical protein Q9314_06225 [Shinella sumterensis]
MTDSTTTLIGFLQMHLAELQSSAREGGILGDRLFQMILGGNAKLPLDRVEEVAMALGCDARQLFRLATRQFYDEKTICLFERMLGTPMTNEEQKWLQEIRSAADGPVAEPSGVAKRLVLALIRPKASA